MKESILIVKVKDKYVCFKTKNVKAIVEVNEDNFQEATLLSKNVIGLITYHGKLYPLVCLSEIVEKKECSVAKGIAVIVQKENKACALLVKEIVGVEVGEKVNIHKGETNVYKTKKGFFEEFNLSILEKLNVPFLILEDEKEKQKKEKKYYLIVMVNNKRYAIEAKLVRKVVETEELNKVELSSKGWINQAFSVGDNVLRTGCLAKLFDVSEKVKPKYIVILEKGKKQFAICVEDVVDIVAVSEEEVSKGTQGKSKTIEGFISSKENVIPFVSSKFLEETLEEEATVITGTNHSPSAKTQKEKFLTFKVGERRFGVEISKVKKLLSLENVKVITYGAERLGGVIQVDKDIYPIANLEEFIKGIKKKVDLNRCDYLLIEEENKVVAIPISEVEGVFNAIPSQTINPDERTIFLKTAVDENKNAFTIIDTKKLVEALYGKEES